MVEIEVTSIKQLVDELNELSNPFIYRGHADCFWKLESSLERILSGSWCAEKVRKFEEYSLAEFKSKFHLYDRTNTEPDSTLAWLSLMQHYGVPTRLLDFSESPYVALYFALESYNLQSRPNFSIFAIDYTALTDASLNYIAQRDVQFNETRKTIWGKQDKIFDSIIDRFAYDIAWVSEPQRLNDRLDRQVGSFLISVNRDIQIETVLQSAIYSGVTQKKYIIDAALYEPCFALLRRMNLTSKTLYGNLDGLARSIKMTLQAYAA